MKTDIKVQKRKRLHKRIRAKIAGTLARPRLNVFRSNKFIYAQLIDDESAKTLASTSDVKIKKGTKAERAGLIGKAIAEAAVALKIKNVVFDRAGFKYAGRVKILADEARKGGLKF